MPMVKGKKFAYTKRGKAAAKRARMKLKKKRSKATQGVADGEVWTVYS